MSDIELQKEITEMLQEAGAPMMIGQLHAVSDLGLGRTSIQEAVTELERDGVIEHETLDNGGRRYRMAAKPPQQSQARGPGDEAVGRNEQASRRARPNAADVAERHEAILSALRAAGTDGLTKADLRESTGLHGPRDLDQALKTLKRRGAIVSRGATSAAKWYDAAAASQPAAASPAADPAEKAASDEAQVPGDPDTWLQTYLGGERMRPDGQHRMAVFEDGTLVISAPGGETVEVPPSELTRLAVLLDAAGNLTQVAR